MNLSKLPALFVSSIAAAAVLVGCGSVDNAATKQPENAADAQEWQAPEGLSGTIDFYSANPQGLTDELVAVFEEKTGVTVNVFSGETGKITARLQAEEANPQADVIYVASWAAASKQSANGGYSDYELDNAAQLHSHWISETGDFVGRDGSALALVANTNVVDDLPTDWEDLTDEKYRDLVIMPDPRESGTAADLIAAMVTKWGEDKTWELFDALFELGF